MAIRSLNIVDAVVVNGYGCGRGSGTGSVLRRRLGYGPEGSLGKSLFHAFLVGRAEFVKDGDALFVVAVFRLVVIERGRGDERLGNGGNRGTSIRRRRGRIGPAEIEVIV